MPLKEEEGVDVSLRIGGRRIVGENQNVQEIFRGDLVNAAVEQRDVAATWAVNVVGPCKVIKDAVIGHKGADLVKSG